MWIQKHGLNIAVFRCFKEFAKPQIEFHQKRFRWLGRGALMLSCEHSSDYAAFTPPQGINPVQKGSEEHNVDEDPSQRFDLLASLLKQ